MRYEALLDALLEAGDGAYLATSRYDIPRQKNTYARFDPNRRGGIAVYLCNDLIATIGDDGLFTIVQGQNITRTAQSRLNQLLDPLGYRIVSRRGTLYITQIATKETIHLVPNHRLFTKGF